MRAPKRWLIPVALLIVLVALLTLARAPFVYTLF